LDESPPEDDDELEAGALELAEHPEGRPSGPPFTVDDLISFHFLLKDDSRLQRDLPRS